MDPSTLNTSALSMPVAALIASLIGATATISATLIQLRIAWRKEIKARESRAPVTLKTRRGPVTAVLVLTVASAVGGFALAQYFATRGHEDALATEMALRARLEQLDRLAARLERAGAQRADARASAGAAYDAASTSAAVTLVACVRAERDDQPCTEADAGHVTLCAGLPPGVRPTRVERYVREQGDPRPWEQVLLGPGEHPVDGRFVGEPGAGTESQTICQEFTHWGGVARTVRLRVHYARADEPAAQVTAHGAR